MSGRHGIRQRVPDVSLLKARDSRLKSGRLPAQLISANLECICSVGNALSHGFNEYDGN